MNSLCVWVAATGARKRKYEAGADVTLRVFLLEKIFNLKWFWQ